MFNAGCNTEELELRVQTLSISELELISELGSHVDARTNCSIHELAAHNKDLDLSEAQSRQLNEELMRERSARDSGFTLQVERQGPSRAQLDAALADVARARSQVAKVEKAHGATEGHVLQLMHVNDSFAWVGLGGAFLLLRPPVSTASSLTRRRRR